MKRIFWFGLGLILGTTASAQKETFDVLSYTVPQGWEKRPAEGGVQFAISDPRTGGYAVAVITKAVPAGASAAENFRHQWAALVRGSVGDAAEPTLAAPAQSNGWDIVSGSADYTDHGTRGTAILLSATGGGRNASVILMTNTQQYQTELAAFLQSLELAASPPAGAAAPAPAPAVGSNNSAAAITGIWGQYQSESFSSVRGPQLTAGYDWREYYINPDGTYQFLHKNISYLAQNDIVITYEKGSWSLTGDQLTITPRSGVTETWSKAGGDHAGRLLKTEPRTLETVTYTAIFRYFSGIQKTNLVLKSGRPTVRDGAFSTNADYRDAWLYGRPFDPNKPTIEVPAGSSIHL